MAGNNILKFLSARSASIIGKTTYTLLGPETDIALARANKISVRGRNFGRCLRILRNNPKKEMPNPTTPKSQRTLKIKECKITE